MNIDRKLAEASYFLDRLKPVEGHDEFQFVVSAFMAAARSVLQYALREMSGKEAMSCHACAKPLACSECGETATRSVVKRTPGQVFYDEFVSARPLMGFMKKLRDAEIHYSPAHLKVGADVRLGHNNGITQRVHFRRGPEGGIVFTGVTTVDGAPVPYTLEQASRFADWPGPERVPELCANYMEDVREFVRAAREHGFLRPGKGAP